ncbi:MAG: cobamide remodeling phosphodiesterase CbiR [Thermoleophilia bacterium]
MVEKEAGAKSEDGVEAEERGLLFGTTSYVLPADLLPNAELLCGIVDDVELVLFEGEESNLPSPEVIERLGELSRSTGTGYTVHLPLDVGLGETEAARRRRAVAVCRHVIELTRPLEPRCYVVHPELPLRYHPALGEEPVSLPELPEELRGTWPQVLADSLAALRNEANEIPLAVENLQYPYGWIWPVVEELDLGVVLDVGHLVKAGGRVDDHLHRFGKRLKVVHLHGVVEGKDHREAGAWGKEGLRSFLSAFRGTTGRPNGRPSEEPPLVVSLEVFGGPPTIASLRAVADALRPEQEAEARRYARAADLIEVALSSARP